MAKWLIVSGAGLLVIGLSVYLFPNLLGWFGRLPGDIRIESERTKIFIPISSMLIISLLLSLVLSFLKR